ncbi:MAG: hypothetical protein PHO26_04735 [Dehalococcoidia bacterium]|nr:hypothetical protein [Dehalococcoidia bacterium]
MARTHKTLTVFGRDLDLLLDRSGRISIREYADEANIDYKYISQLRNDPGRRPGRSYVSMLKPFARRNVLELGEAQQLSLRHRARLLSPAECNEIFPGLSEEEVLASIDEAQKHTELARTEKADAHPTEMLYRPVPFEAPAYDKPQVPVTQWDEMNVVLREMGIFCGTYRLSASKWEPLQCMSRSQRKLWFMGIVGSKWVSEEYVFAEFKKFARRIQARNGEVRFLLMNPEGKAISRLKVLRGGALSVESLERFKELMAEFECLQVRLCDQMPSFRLVFIDDKTVAVSRYKLDKESYYQSRFGWEAPHLVIHADAPWSLYDAFEYFYEQVWDTSIGL